jgi:hypothetical protein
VRQALRGTPVPPTSQTLQRHGPRREPKTPDDIATSFRMWIENSSAFFHHGGVSTPHTGEHDQHHATHTRSAHRFQPHTQENMTEACPYSNAEVAFPLRVLRVTSWRKKPPDRSPAQQALCGTPVPPSSPTLGRHGPRRDASRVQVIPCCYFLWKKVTKELCGIGTHASIAAPRAVGFGACKCIKPRGIMQCAPKPNPFD